MARFATNSNYLSVAAALVVGLFSVFSPAESPGDAVKRFAQVFSAMDAAALKGQIHPDIVDGKELRVEEVEAFLAPFKARSPRFKEFRVDKQLQSKEGDTKRFQATLLFSTSPLSPQYQGETTLEMTLLWVLQDKKWMVERPLSVRYRVVSNVAYPTAEQEELAMRFRTAMEILRSLGLSGKEDIDLAVVPKGGTAAAEYKELERLYKTEKGPKGIEANARGVSVLIKGASRTKGGILQLYHGDFKSPAADTRRPAPWEMFRDYVRAAIERGKSLERKGKLDAAEAIYRSLISLGRQFLDEPGGYHFVSWGLTFQIAGAQELVRVLRVKGSAEKNKAEAFVRLSSRRLDLLSTAFRCLDSMADYGALKAAVDASTSSEAVFRPWAVSTLVIFALQGAPAGEEITAKAGAMVLVDNPAMRNIAEQALEKLASDSSASLRAFIDSQKKWVRANPVYGTVADFK